MRVTKEMLDNELRRYYLPAKLIALVLSQRRLVSLIRKMEDGLNGRVIDGLQCEERTIPSREGGHHIRIRIFRPPDQSGELPGYLYLHGGGYIIGKPEEFLPVISKFIQANPCVVVAPDYRKAGAAPYPAAFDDCYDTLLWMNENHEEVGIIPDRFVVGGHSAGGGLTAALSLKARDTQEVRIAFQLPIYPMIDDRQTTESARDCDAPAWNSATNQFGWSEYLRGLKEKSQEIPAYAAAARAKDYSGLPPTITFVGGLEPFRDETNQYVQNLRESGVPVSFKLFEGCFHGFDVIAPGAEVSQAAWNFVLESFSEYIEKYFFSS